MTLLASGGLSAADLTSLLLGLGVMLGLARLLGELARTLGQPTVLGEILAGVLLGPTVMGRLAPGVFASVFPDHGGAFIATSGFMTVAVVLLLLVAGLELDLSVVWRQGRAALLVSLTGLLLPAGIGVGMGFAMPEMLGKAAGAPVLPFALFLGIAMAITALPIIAKVLMDLNMFRTDLGMLIMSAAMVDDLIGWMAFAVVLAMMVGGPHDAPTLSVAGTIVGTLLFAGFALTLLRWGMHRVLPWVQARGSWPSGVLGLMLSVTLLCAAFTEWLGVHAIFGAFLAGIAIGDSPHLRERTKANVEQFVGSLFAPLFFANIGLHIDFFSAFNPLITGVILFVAVVVKVGGCGVGARWAGFSHRESLAIGFGMASRGAMEIVLAQLARGAGLINDELFIAIVLMALITSLISGPAMQRVLRREKPVRLNELLSEKAFRAPLVGDTPAAAIEELVGTLAGQLPLPADEVVRRVLEREEMIGTGLGRGLAVPHARLPIARTLVAVGRSEHGVDFDAADGTPAGLVVLILSPEDDASAHLELLSQLAHLMEDPEARRTAWSARTSIEFKAAVNTVPVHG